MKNRGLQMKVTNKIKEHMETFNWYVLTLTDFFVSQKSVNVYEHTCI
jgi:hypothetical protein